jgi:serine/threonine-protein kinase PknK
VLPRRAVELVERDAMLLVEQSRMSLLLALLDKLSPSAVADRPGLQVAIAWARCLLYMPGETGAMLAAFAPSDPAQAAELDLIRAVNVGFEHDDPERIAPLLERAMRHLRAEPWLLGVAANVSAFTELRRGHFAAARDAATRGRPHQDRARGSFSAVYGRCIEGLAQQEVGDLGGAERSFERALDVAVRDAGRHSYATRMASAFLGAIRYERDDREGASTLLEAAFSVRESGIPDIPITVYVARIRLHEARGDHDAALAELYEGARQATSQRLERLAAAVMHEQVRVHLAAGDVDLAARRCDAAVASRPPEAHRQQAWELGALARARVAIARGHAKSALPLLIDLRDRVQAEGRRRFELSLRAVLALANQAAGDGTAARAELAAALTLGEEQGAVRTLADEGQALHALLRRLPASPYVARILGVARSASAVAVAPVVGTGDAMSAASARTSLIEPLNVRELQILRLIEEGMVNKDVSATLGIGLDTVKWHLKNAYKKLGAATRTGAIHSAPSAGVLGTRTPRSQLAST